MADDEPARAERARKLREELDRLAGGASPRAPRSPHEFVEEQMRKLESESGPERDDSEQDDDER